MSRFSPSSAPYPSKPVATYTYTGNQVISPTALDVSTNTFTATAHGLTNNTVIFPAWNNATTGNLPNGSSSTYPAGMTQTIYYVVGATTDTFQISTTSGGSALDITNNTNFSSMHFQKATILSFTISNLESMNKCYIRAIMYSAVESVSQYGYEIRPSNWLANGDLQPNALAGAYYNVGKVGSVGTQLWLEIDGTLNKRAVRCSYATHVYGTAGTSGTDNRVGVNNYSDSSFTSIYVGLYNNLANGYIANGTRVEVYKV